MQIAKTPKAMEYFVPATAEYLSSLCKNTFLSTMRNIFFPSILLIGVEALATVIINVLVPVD